MLVIYQVTNKLLGSKKKKKSNRVKQEKILARIKQNNLVKRSLASDAGRLTDVD